MNLSKEYHIDITMWLRFLHSWSGTSIFCDCKLIIAAVMQIYTDAASTIAFGCYFNGLWFAEKLFPDILAQSRYYILFQ